MKPLIATIYYSENGKDKSKDIELPENCLGDHAKTVDFINIKMGGNNNWDSYDIVNIQEEK